MQYTQSFCPVWTTQCTIYSVVLSSLDYPVYNIFSRSVQSELPSVQYIQSFCPDWTTQCTIYSVFLSSLDYPVYNIFRRSVQSGLPSVYNILSRSIQSGLPTVEYIQSFCPVWTTHCRIYSVILSSLDYPVYNIFSRAV